MEFIIGQRVRHSGYALRSDRDWWLAQGDYTKKQRAKDTYDKRCAERGTITAILPGDAARGIAPGLQVTWDNGSVSKCLSCRVERAE